MQSYYKELNEIIRFLPMRQSMHVWLEKGESTVYVHVHVPVVLGLVEIFLAGAK